MSATQMSHPNHPIPFDPAMEVLGEDEHEVAQALRDQMRKIMETTSKDYGHAVRSVHAKSHGLLVGELTVLDNLPQELRQGLFAEARSYEAVLRLSTNPGDILDDSISVPRGAALKIMGVAGPRLPGAEGAQTQDFVMVNAPAFPAPDAAGFLQTLKLLAATTDTPQGLKKVASTVLRGAEKALEAVGGESAALKTMGGHPNTHILGETFYTAAPLLFGRYIAKLSLAPLTPHLRALADETLKVDGRANALREEVERYFAGNDAEWELRAQLLNDPEAMPIEDASVEWPQDTSPYLPVARLRVPRQGSWSEDRVRKIDEGLAFSPWHGIEAHRPLGSIMRSRKLSYEMSAEFRSRFNGCPIHEPSGRAELGV